MSSPIPTRPLGRTGLQLPILSFGASSLGAEFRPVKLDEALASVRVAEAAATLGAAKAKSGSFAAATPVKTTGLSPALAALLEGREA